VSLSPEQVRNLCFLSATELAGGYRARRFSPIDVVDSHLSRIDALDGFLHAFTEVFHSEARAAAAASAQRYWAGQAQSPLDGIPVAVKDLIEIEGKACAAGSATRRGHIAGRTAPVVTQLVNNGAVVIGKTHTVEFALGGWGTNPHLGSPRNPWVSGTHYTPGGSSSGSAVAVAARLATLAIGTDTGGSVRVPAAFNGLAGLKTTPGRISLEGVVPLSPSLDTIGTIARTVSDAALLFRALLDDPASSADPLVGLDDGVHGLTLGAVGKEDLEFVDVDIVHAYHASLRRFEKLGARIVAVDLPRRLHDYQRDSEILMAEAYALYGDLAEDPSAPMDPSVRARILTGAISARSYIFACSRARTDACAMLAAIRGCDALLTPTARTLPVPLADVDETTTPSTLARFVNQIGFCGLAIPNGLSPTGLPTSLQIVCRPNEEHLALRIGRASEIGDPFFSAVPPMA
jgi:aspartyl-tRNA(Asn)/glutamyl-tRNA(Gln) amidotransferase subunit A